MTIAASKRSTRAPSRPGFSLLETVIASVTVLVLLAALLPMLGGGAARGAVHVSANNLRRIADGCSAYEASWGGRQWTKLSPAMGLYNGCGPYSASTCPPTMVLGWDAPGGLWGYWISGTPSACAGWPGTCGNWIVMMPIAIGGTTGDPAFGTGSWQFVNARGVREYVTSRFYDPVFYSPNDALPYQQLQANYFNSPVEFSYNSTVYWGSTYTLSPAALWGDGVFRRPSEGGFQAPDDFPGAYDTATASAVTYPNVKTRLMEGRWCQNPPALTVPGTTTTDTPTPYYSNGGAGSVPGTAFFDGHVSFVPMSTFAADDAAATKQTGEGLWSRDTPIGPEGLFAAFAIDGFRNSSHILTTGGITGRDLLQAR